MKKLPMLTLLLLSLQLTVAVRVFPSTHKARSFAAENLKDAKSALFGVRKDLHRSASNVSLLQSSFDDQTLSSPISPSTNGLVYSLIDAYSNHRHLIIRPEDIWLAVLTQLSSYINAHGEEMRHKFVAHQGKKELVIDYKAASRHHVDYAHFANTMTSIMEEHIIDRELREWILPNFSTTTKNDMTVAAMMMMCSMQKYFSYRITMICGIPSVTLLGEKKDYEDILSRLDKLSTFGEEPTRFMQFLKPVIRRFILSFDAPESQPVIDFWQRVLDKNNQVSGLTEYTGWVTAFCAWDEKGNFQADWLKGQDEDYSENGDFGEKVDRNHYYHQDLHLSLDGVKYPVISSESVPPGWGKVPVEIEDNGRIFEAEMVAGSVGQGFTSTGETDESGRVGLDTTQPHAGWWIWEQTGLILPPEVETSDWYDFEDEDDMPSFYEMRDEL